jgi:hypothetical protein
VVLPRDGSILSDKQGPSETKIDYGRSALSLFPFDRTQCFRRHVET